MRGPGRTRHCRPGIPHAGDDYSDGDRSGRDSACRYGDGSCTSWRMRHRRRCNSDGLFNKSTLPQRNVVAEAWRRLTILTWARLPRQRIASPQFSLRLAGEQSTRLGGLGPLRGRSLLLFAVFRDFTSVSGLATLLEESGGSRVRAGVSDQSLGLHATI